MSTHTPRLTIVNGSNTQLNHPNTNTTATIPTTHSTIDDFREIAREQSFIMPNSSMDVPVKKYPPLPEISIPSVNNTFFRTESTLTQPKQTTQIKKQIFNHFAPTQRAHLPTLNKRQNLLVTNAMDLDEDLPQCNTNSTHRAATYTSPGERIISPIKRPSAPSPPTSAQIKRLGAHSLIDDDDDDEERDDERYSHLDNEDSEFFNEHFSRYQQPIIMSNRRIDHYNHRIKILDRHPTIIINDGHEESIQTFDSNNFES
jgi:hypothetical protein